MSQCSKEQENNKIFSDIFSIQKIMNENDGFVASLCINKTVAIKIIIIAIFKL